MVKGIVYLNVKGYCFHATALRVYLCLYYGVILGSPNRENCASRIEERSALNQEVKIFE